MTRISAVVNTRNEEGNIRYCLEALAWCDEIVVVDMESEDSTVAIAGEFTDRIFIHKKILAFDAAREFAVNHATGEWILLIDADELVPSSLAGRLREIARENQVDAVYIPFKNYLLGAWNRFTGWWPDYHCRFFKKDAMTFSGDIHAYQRLSDQASICYLPAEEPFAVHHFAYRDVEHFITKLNRYTAIEAEKYRTGGTAFSPFRLFKGLIGDFLTRYIRMKGYKDGTRGLFVSLMLGFYRAVSYMKLWELENGSGADVYGRDKKEIIDGYRDRGM